MPEAPVIQPNASPGGASLAPDAGAPGATINPTEARVQQQAAAAVAAQQASAAYAKRERDVREYTDALVEYHDLPDEFRSTEAPEMTMVNRRGSEISSLRSPKGADLAANARDAETQRFADWERDQLFEGDKLHRARDYLYYQRERANAGVTSYFSGERTGNYERDLVDVQQAYNEARNEGRDFVWEGKIADTEDLAHAFSLGMINLGANESTKEAMYKAYVQDPLKIGRAGVLADPNSAESKELLEKEYQDYLKFRDTPLTFENKVYMPRVAPERIAADAAKNAARVEYNAAQSEYVANLHNFMVNTGYKSFEDLGRDIAEFKIHQASQPTFTDQVRAAERADWIAYQNRSAAEQTNPVLRDYAAAAEREAEYNLLGQPVGIARVPTLTNAEKYAVLNEMSGGQFLYNPLTDQISKKQQVDTSDYLTTKWYNDFVNSAPVSAIRETFGIDNWGKQIAENKAKEGVVEGDMTGRGFFYAPSEWLVTLPNNILNFGNAAEHLVKNPESLGNVPGNIIPAANDILLSFEKDPHRFAGTLVASSLAGSLLGTAGVGAISRIGSKGSAGVFRAADTPHAPFGKDTPSFSSGLFGTVRRADADSAVRTPGISESVADVSDLVPYHQAMGYRYDPFQQNNRIYGYAWENRQKSLQNPTWDFDKGELKLYDRATTEFGFTPNEARGLILNQRQNNFQNSMMRLVLDETEKGRARQERRNRERQSKTGTGTNRGSTRMERSGSMGEPAEIHPESDMGL